MNTPIAILGAGQVGQALGQALARHGHRIRYGVPDPARHAALAAAPGGRISVGTVEDAIGPAELVILATPHLAALQVARQVPDWAQRVLVDATNPIAPGLAGLTVGTTTSGAEEIARLARHARVVKAFNTTGFENMADPHYPGGDLFMPVAGDDAEARARVLALATLIGFDAVDLGPLAAARYLEPMAMVWIELALRRGHGRDFGFVRATREG
jgi:8-hydroxy-5-deazaflavin:NADPH oxidoreductase